jgi:hypothetical protein
MDPASDVDQSLLIDMLVNFSAVLLECAQQDSITSASALDEARNMLLRVEELSPGMGAYNLVCFSALVFIPLFSCTLYSDLFSVSQSVSEALSFTVCSFALDISFSCVRLSNSPPIFCFVLALVRSLSWFSFHPIGVRVRGEERSDFLRKIPPQSLSTRCERSAGTTHVCVVSFWSTYTASTSHSPVRLLFFWLSSCSLIEFFCERGHRLGKCEQRVVVLHRGLSLSQ